MANRLYDNFILENKIKSIIDTKLNANRLFTTNYGLTTHPGMIYKIHKYLSDAGKAEWLAKTEGNTKVIEAGYADEEYVVGTVQDKTIWYDEDEMTDPVLVDTLVKGVGENITEFILKAAIGEMENTKHKYEIDWTQATTTPNYIFGLIADALAIIAENNIEEDSNYCIYIHPSKEAVIRKSLLDNLKYTEDYIRTGAIGAVCGVPVYRSNDIPEDCMFVENSGAMTCFLKKNLETETDRDPDTRKNYLWARQVGVIAMTDENKCIAYCPAGTAPTLDAMTTASTKVKGECAPNSNVVAYLNDEFLVNGESDDDGDFEMNIPDGVTLVAGDIVKVTVFEGGKAPATATVTVTAS